MYSEVGCDRAVAVRYLAGRGDTISVRFNVGFCLYMTGPNAPAWLLQPPNRTANSTIRDSVEHRSFRPQLEKQAHRNLSQCTLVRPTTTAQPPRRSRCGCGCGLLLVRRRPLIALQLLRLAFLLCLKLSRVTATATAAAFVVPAPEMWRPPSLNRGCSSCDAGPLLLVLSLPVISQPMPRETRLCLYGRRIWSLARRTNRRHAFLQGVGFGGAAPGSSTRQHSPVPCSSETTTAGRAQ
jgi:hypothetical protein